MSTFLDNKNPDGSCCGKLLMCGKLEMPSQTGQVALTISGVRSAGCFITTTFACGASVIVTNVNIDGTYIFNYKTVTDFTGTKAVIDYDNTHPKYAPPVSRTSFDGSIDCTATPRSGHIPPCLSVLVRHFIDKITISSAGCTFFNFSGFSGAEGVAFNFDFLNSDKDVLRYTGVGSSLIHGSSATATLVVA